MFFILLNIAIVIGLLYVFTNLRHPYYRVVDWVEEDFPDHPLDLILESMLDDSSKEPDPIFEDFIADLFMGMFGGHLAMLIDSQDREFHYYRQIYEMMVARLKALEREGIVIDKLDKHDFNVMMIKEFQKLPNLKLQVAIGNRFRKLLQFIAQSDYYQRTGFLEILDITESMEYTLKLIDHHRPRQPLTHESMFAYGN